MPAIRGRVCARAFLYALVFACLVLACAAVKASAAAVPADFYGVNAGGTVVNDVAGRSATFAAMRAGGLSSIRSDASWNYAEPMAPVGGVHAYVWTKFDLLIADLARNGLRWYPMIGYSSPWASSVTNELFAPPAGDADFAAYAAALAKRYGFHGSFWAQHPELPKLPPVVYGIWNEPDNDTFWRGGESTPARYMRLYLEARNAIKAIDPGARVATAGLLDSGTVDGAAYLRAMLDSAPAARNQIDALGWHPYTGSLEQILESVKSARATLDRYGLAGVPIEISEVGWHTGWSAAERAQWLRGLAAALPHAGLNVTRLMPYVWSGSPEWQITDPDGSLGLVGGSFLAGIRDALAAPAATASSASTPNAAAAKKTAKAKKASKPCKVKKIKASKKTKKTKKTRKAKAAKKCATTAKAAKAGKKKRAKPASRRPRARGGAAQRTRVARPAAPRA